MPTYDPPRLFGNSASVLVLHDGHLLLRLDPATGQRRWKCFLAEDLSERPESVVFNDKHLYCVNFESIGGVVRQSLRAIALDDGARVWASPLSGPLNSMWSLALAEGAVFAYPSAVPSADKDNVGTMSLFARRPSDGALIERLVFPTAISDVTFKLDPQGAILATSSGMWALGSKIK